MDKGARREGSRGEVGLALSLKSARNVAGRGEEVSTPDFPSRP